MNALNQQQNKYLHQTWMELSRQSESSRCSFPRLRMSGKAAAHNNDSSEEDLVRLTTSENPQTTNTCMLIFNSSSFCNSSCNTDTLG